MNETGRPVLQIRGLRKRLASAGTRFDLEVPDLSFERGRFYGLVGRSGSGKSTLLDLLAMVARPDEVETMVLDVGGERVDLVALLRQGNDAAISAVRLKHFGYVLQSGGLFSFLSVRENLALPMMMAGRSVDTVRIEALAETFDISAHLDKHPSGLSGGQRQRVSILRALVLAPGLILADEPTAAVDEAMAGVIVGELRRLAQQEGATVIMVSHDRELVTAHADMVITLRPERMGENVVRSVVAEPTGIV